MNAKPLLKAAAACLGIAAIAAAAGPDLFPAVPTLKVLAYAGCVALFVLAFAAVAIVAGQQWNRFGLNHRGTDPQWMWFGGEPPGLQKERERGESSASATPSGEVRRPAVSGDD